MLTANNENYNCLLLQPSGPIFANAHRIGHQNQGIAGTRCRKFLELAQQNPIHFAAAPEYCLPWDTLATALSDGIFPALGSLWALGCESISPADLEGIKQRFADVDDLVFVHEQFDANITGTFFDPLALLFQTRRTSGALVKIVLLQFKSAPCRDEHFLENQHLIRGHSIYRFQNTGGRLSFASIICSDAFSIADDGFQLEDLHDRATLLHIQLNPSPRHRDYKLYPTGYSICLIKKIRDTKSVL